MIVIGRWGDTLEIAMLDKDGRKRKKKADRKAKKADTKRAKGSLSEPSQKGLRA